MEILRLRSLLRIAYPQEEKGGTATEDLDPAFIEALQKRIDDLNESGGASWRLINCLGNAGVHYIWQLAEKTEIEARKMRSFGPMFLAAMAEIMTELHPDIKYGMKIPKIVREPSFLLQGVEALNLSVRSENALQNAGILTIKDLVQKAPQDIITGLRGHTSQKKKIITEIEETFKAFHPELRLGMKLG